MKTDKVFIPTEIELPELKAGDQVEMFFNNRGRAEICRKKFKKNLFRGCFRDIL